MLEQYRGSSQGGVSIFIVIFTALLVTVIATSYTQLMVRSQQQATEEDLSNSAYDSAMAGVEDAKRALVRMQECQLGDTAADEVCADGIRDALDTASCDSLQAAGVVTFNSSGEVPVGAPEQNQAYTCVKVALDTDSYKDDGVSSGKPVVIPLKTRTGSTATGFNKITISWFAQKDITTGETVATFPTLSPSFPAAALPLTSSDLAGWPSTAPALLRLQLIQFKHRDIDISKFNDKQTDNAKTLFLYPQDTPVTTLDFDSDDRRKDGNSENNLQVASCSSNFSTNGGYACKVTINVPLPDGVADKKDREAYLEVQPFYQDATSFKVELYDGSTKVNLHEVQPRVDSTGRASTLFRRVEANISLRNSGLDLGYPDAALSVNGDICKNFFVTDNEDEFNSRSEDSGCDY